jgi:type I restriction enzyme R subunit
MVTNTTERGLEDLIVAEMTGGAAKPGLGEAATSFDQQYWLLGAATDFDRYYAVDLRHLAAFITATQPKAAEQLDLANASATRRAFLARLQGEITKRGIVDCLRRGLDHGPVHVDLFYGTPSVGNAAAAARFQANRFVVTRQLRYSKQETANALDLTLFINGLPVITLELKNRLTKQTVHDAVEQYRRDRDPRELIFSFTRCIAHLAVDEHEVRFCTKLAGKASWFLPFNLGWNDGAGNPPNPHGLATDYLWKQILTPRGLTDIIEHYAQRVEKKDEKTGKKKVEQIFPRYHQLGVVRKLLADVRAKGAGRRYLIQHSAGSGKSNSIGWLTHQLIDCERDGKKVFNTIIVITDRTILDQQIRDTIKQFAQVSSTIGAVTGQGDSKTGQLRDFLAGGKRVIIATIQTFPFVLDEIGSHHRQGTFAVIIDEAHSSQGGKASAAMSKALSAIGEQDEEESAEDRINRIMESRKLLPNASYFAFTATPKNKTLEVFGEAYRDGEVTKHRPFHSYTMKQAIQEGFILDVLKHYTPVNSYYKLVKKVDGDPEFDVKKAQRKLRSYVEGHSHAIGEKAEIMVDHFHDQVIARNKIGGEARAMVVTNGIERAIQYFQAVSAYLEERKSPYKAIVAFSGEHEFGGAKVTEASLNGFPSNVIKDKIQEHPYRFLICADKFQTGYDEPLLHTMYVDKTLAGIKAVQTLSRLNRAHPQKSEAFVLDFANDEDGIRESFAPFYRTTMLAGETDPNKLNDLKRELDDAQVYTAAQVNELVEKYLAGADRPELEPLLTAAVEEYQKLSEDDQVAFKGKAKSFVRTYSFLAMILPSSKADWERLSIYLNFLVLKLPAPKEEDLAKGILETIDMDSYRSEKKATRKVELPDENAEIGPWTDGNGGKKPEPDLKPLDTIIKEFNEHFGNVPWTDADRVRRLITEDIPTQVAADKALQNAMKNTPTTARDEHDRALNRVMTAVLKDDTQLVKMFFDDPGFKKWLADSVYRAIAKAG